MQGIYFFILKTHQKINTWVFLLVLSFLTPFFANFQAKAQELPPPPAEIAEDYEEDYDDDDSLSTEEIIDQHIEEALFEEDKEDEEGYQEEKKAFIEFEFSAKIQFFRGLHDPNKPDGLAELPSDPFLENVYTTRFQGEFIIGQQTEMEAQFEVDNWGFLEKSEFFECRLEIEMPEIPLVLLSNLRPNVKDDQTQTLALKIKPKQNIQEDWIASCEDTSRSVMVTQGKPEEYNNEILKKIEPTLKALMLEEFDGYQSFEIPLKVNDNFVVDAELDQTLMISGSGKLKVEPY